MTDKHYYFDNHSEEVIYIQDELRNVGNCLITGRNISEYWIEYYKKCSYSVLYDVRSSNDKLLRSTQIRFRVIPIHSDPKPFYRVFLDAICCQSNMVNLEITFYLEEE